MGLGHKRIGTMTAAAAVALLAPLTLSGCTSAGSAAGPSPGHAIEPAPTGSGTPAVSAPAPAQALATKLSSAFSSAATRAASVAATAARSVARTSSPSRPPASTNPVTRASVSLPGHVTTAPRPASPVTGDPSLESEILSMLDQEREQNGLPALQLSGALTTSARRHSAAMAAAQTLSHQLPGEADLPQREAAAGFHGSAWAENVGETPQGNASGAVSLQDLLYSDPPHRANILATSVHAVGVGIVIDSRGQLWLTEDFGG